MDVNLLLGATSLIGLGAGAWALVFYRKNGNGHPPAVVRPVTDAKLADALEKAATSLAELPRQIDASFTDFLETQALREPEILPEPPEPAWATSLTEQVSALRQQLSVEPLWPLELRRSIEILTVDLTSRMDALVQTAGRPPKVELPPVNLPEIENKLEKLAQQLSRLAPPAAKVQPSGQEPGVRRARSLTRAASPIQLQIYNTVNLMEFVVYELIPPEPDIFDMNIFNLGVGTVWVRDDAEPILDDALAITLPAATGINEVHVPRRMYMVADDGGVSVSIQLSHR
jgi:hypothetical protein